MRATGTPASGPGSRPAATAASTASAAARAASAVTRLKAWTSASRRVDAGQVLLDHRRARSRPAGPRRRSSAARSGGAGTRRLAGHGASPRIRGTRKRSASTAGRLGQHLVPVEAGHGAVVAQHVDQRQGVGGRRHARGVQGLDVRGVLEHGAQLLGEAVQLVGGERQPGQPGHVGHLGGRDAGRPWRLMVGGASPGACRVTAPRYVHAGMHRAVSNGRKSGVVA